MFSGMLSIYSSFHTKDRLFQDASGIWYVSTEQFLQYRKATICGDKYAAMNILCEMDPLTIKQIGDKVQVTEEWKRVARDVMLEGITAKFTQNPLLAESLLSTGDRSFVDCNRYDKFWGTGMSLNYVLGREAGKLVNDMPGRNIMGDILDTVKASLIEKHPVV